MENFLLSFTAVFQISVFAISLYFIILAFFGIYKRKTKKIYEPEKSFALLVAAHNEEAVIANIIESLNMLDYPKELYDIFIIADNCNDKTASIARKLKVKVFERFNTSKVGKGYALEWMFDKIFNMEKKYDAVAIFDADNIISKNFLTEMNNKMMEGYKVVQGYLDSKNPSDSWITQSYSISFWTANRIFQLARNNIGLTNQLGGTGFIVETDILKKIGWGATCLTEDLEFTCKLVLNGYKVGWAHDAVVYDEKPLTLKQSWNQRKRWMQGFSDVASRYFFPLMKNAFTKCDFVSFDCALYSIQPFITLLLGLSLLLTVLQNNNEHGLNIFVINNLLPGYIWKAFSIFQFLFTPFIMILEKKIRKSLFVFLSLYSLNIIFSSMIIGVHPPFIETAIENAVYIAICILITYVILGKKQAKLFIWYILYGVYTLTWIPITLQGIVNKNKKEWSHTKHTRAISIHEVTEYEKNA
ncbi:MAG: glycosyltransferase family 2 protein [Eubacteriaceae bacterium]|nr:glycosyltransferase family 2 protein [Eubacteriaceae bacterium]